MNAIILAGGQATRMGDLAKTIPKCLVEVADKPILWWQLDALAKAEVWGAFVTCRDAQEGMLNEYLDFYHRMSDFPVTTEVVPEKEPLGTGGAIWTTFKEYDELTQPLLVLNGDIIPGPWLRELAEHKDDGALAVLGVQLRENTGPFGVVDVHFDGRIGGFREPSEEAKRVIEGAGGYINTGVYWMHPGIFDEIDFSATIPCSLERDIFPLLAERGLLRALNCIGPWYAVDTPTDVMRVSQELAAP